MIENNYLVFKVNIEYSRNILVERHGMPLNVLLTKLIDTEIIHLEYIVSYSSKYINYVDKLNKYLYYIVNDKITFK